MKIHRKKFVFAHLFFIRFLSSLGVLIPLKKTNRAIDVICIYFYVLWEDIDFFNQSYFLYGNEVG